MVRAISIGGKYLLRKIFSDLRNRFQPFVTNTLSSFHDSIALYQSRYFIEKRWLMPS